MTKNMEPWPGAISVALVVVVFLSGCAWPVGGEDLSESVTPAPVPDVTPSGSSFGPTYDTGQVTDDNARIFRLRPTCNRPPELVIHIQVLALAKNQPANNEGINTTWQFAAPSNKEVTGPYSNFVRIIRSQYQPLLNAEKIEYGSIDRSNARATMRVTVTDANGSSRTYRWVVTKQTEGLYDGCWMTTSVSPDIQSRRGVATGNASSMRMPATDSESSMNR